MSHIRINSDTLYTNIPADLNLAIISDIHIDYLPKRIEQLKLLVEQIALLSPNYILIPGDIIQSHKVYLKNIYFLMENLSKIAPTIVSIGNHELEASKNGLSLSWFYNLNEIHNVFALSNTCITLNNIQFTGFSPRFNAYKFVGNKEIFITDYISTNLAVNNNSNYNIMLIHDPNVITEETISNNFLSNYNLFVSGHNHNGCTPKCLESFFKTHGIIGPYFNLYPDNCRGIKNVGNSKLFISKGFRKITQENIIMNTLDSMYDNDIHELKLRKY